MVAAVAGNVERLPGRGLSSGAGRITPSVAVKLFGEQSWPKREVDSTSLFHVLTTRAVLLLPTQQLGLDGLIHHGGPWELTKLKFSAVWVVVLNVIRSWCGGRTVPVSCISHGFLNPTSVSVCT
jgi:hypothetical protein